MEKMTLQEQEKKLKIIKGFVEDYYAPANTKQAYYYDLKVFSRYCQQHGIESLDEVNLAIILQYFHDSKETKTFATLRRYKVAFLKVPHLKPLVESKEFKLLMKAIENQADLTVKHPKPMKYIDVAGKVLQLRNQKYRFLFLLMFKGAFRVSEMLNLKINDISVEEQGLQITIRKSKTSNKPATIGLQSLGIDVVGDWLEYKETLKDDRVFPMSRIAVHEYIKKHLGSEYSSHSFRNGHVTHSLQHNVPIEKIQKTTRHKDVNVLLSHYYVPGSSFENSTDII